MTLLFVDPRFLEHNTGRHPESAERLRAIHQRLERSNVRERVSLGAVTAATHEQLALVHSARHIKDVEDVAKSGGGPIEPDTIVSRQSFVAASLAAGTTITAVDNVLAKTGGVLAKTGGSENAETDKHRRALCLVRPPGHHALPDKAMGFCLFNNVAIAAKHAQQKHGLSRILIVDWDVHHGNGTQDVFYQSAEVYFFSVHRHPFYPGTGAADETGSGPGAGTIFNLPLPFGVTRKEYLERFRNMLETAAAKCRPELILISAGFDAHRADPVGSLGLETEDFRTLTQLVVAAANAHCQGRIVSVLEGGYNVTVLADCVQGHLEELTSDE